MSTMKILCKGGSPPLAPRQACRPAAEHPQPGRRCPGLPDWHSRVGNPHSELPEHERPFGFGILPLPSDRFRRSSGHLTSADTDWQSADTVAIFLENLRIARLYGDSCPPDVRKPSAIRPAGDLARP